MAVPKKKLSKSRRGMRRSHDAISPVSVLYCKNCGQPVMPHMICKNCGEYFKKQVN